MVLVSLEPWGSSLQHELHDHSSAIYLSETLYKYSEHADSPRLSLEI